MFRRTSRSPESAEPGDAVEAPAAADPLAPSRPASKGRPTPSRREAEAAARARAKPARTRKELAARDRAARAERQAKVREAMRTGDDTHMPPRDKGPKKRLVRDVVDARFGFTELILPLMILSLVMQYSGNAQLQSTGVLVFLMMFILVVLDVFWLRFRLRREVRKRFGDESQKGLMFYAVTRSMQVKPLRMPKPQVKIGAKLPERY
ncbi:DUF3043 domain-containing protein [Nocardioides zeae]|uniref:DUF3043 domain-containing protein n=1 Tax=Nocardioides imazamoxiresistens TaxID=3231893 RepID=A0ABU3PX57_9ACTN|nr:DUF3043 domain-containing protein [Nocardioides zeae]MDT9593827.1 DUF3043 domain-containing protein [Nocardioides zeae]